MTDAVPSTTKEVYDPTAFTTIADLYAALKNEQTGIFERALLCLKCELEARADAAPGIGLLDAYLRIGNIEELTRLWDRSRELNSMTVDVLMVASFRELMQRCSRLPELRSVGTALARAIIQDRMKLVYRLLSASKSNANIAALGLLTAINAQGSIIAGELYTNFNFSLNALRRISSRLSMQSKDNTKDKSKFAKLERAHYVHFMLSFIKYGDISVKKAVISSKEFATGVLGHLHLDSNEIIEETLNAVKEHIVQERRLPRFEVISIFTSSLLEHIVKLFTIYTDDIKNVVYQFFVDICHPQYGLCGSDEHWQMQDNNSSSSVKTTEKSKSSKRRLPNGSDNHRFILRLLPLLKLTDDTKQRDLLLFILGTWSNIIGIYWKSNSLSFEPRLSTPWLVNMSLLQKILMLPVPALDATMRPPSTASIMVHILPQTSLPRNLLSRGLQHANTLVQYTMLCCMEQIFTKMSKVTMAIQDIMTRSKDPTIWQTTLEDVQLRLWLSLPDVQTIIGLVAKKAENERSDLLSEKAINVIGHYLRCQNKQMTGQKFNLNKLWPADLFSVHPRLQLCYLTLMKTSYYSKATNQPNLLVDLLPGPMTLCISSPCAEIRSMAIDVVVSGLSASTLFEHHHLEAWAYIDAFTRMALPGQSLTDDTRIVLQLLVDAVKMCLASPYAAADAVVQTTSRAMMRHPLPVNDIDANKYSSRIRAWIQYQDSLTSRLPVSPLLWALLEQWKMQHYASCRGVAIYMMHLLRALSDGFVPAIFLGEFMEQVPIALYDSVEPLTAIVHRLKSTSWLTTRHQSCNDYDGMDIQRSDIHEHSILGMMQLLSTRHLCQIQSRVKLNQLLRESTQQQQRMMIIDMLRLRILLQLQTLDDSTPFYIQECLSVMEYIWRIDGFHQSSIDCLLNDNVAIAYFLATNYRDNQQDNLVEGRISQMITYYVLFICWRTQTIQTLPMHLRQSLGPWALYVSTTTTASLLDYEETAIVLQVLGPIIEDSSLMAIMERLLKSSWPSEATPIIVRLMGNLFALMAGRQDTMSIVRNNAESLLQLWRQSTDEILDEVMLVVVAATSPLLFANASTIVYERSIHCQKIFAPTLSTMPFHLQDNDIERLLVDATSVRLELLVIAATLDGQLRSKVARLLNTNHLSASVSLIDLVEFTTRYTQLYCPLHIVEMEHETDELVWYSDTNDEAIQSVCMLMNRILHTILTSSTHRSQVQQAIILLQRWWPFSTLEYRRQCLLELQRGLQHSNSTIIMELVSHLLVHQDESLHPIYTQVVDAGIRAITSMTMMPESINTALVILLNPSYSLVVDGTLVEGLLVTITTQLDKSPQGLRVVRVLFDLLHKHNDTKSLDEQVTRWIEQLVVLSLSWLSNGKYRAELLELLLALSDYGATSIFSSTLVDLLMPHYTASLSLADQYQLAFLWHYERSEKEEPMLVHALQWSPHPNITRTVTPLLHATSTPEQVAAVQALLNDIDRERMWHTIRHFPITRCIDARVINKDEENNSENNERLYDPLYFLSIFSFLASLNGVVPTRMWVETHALGLAVVSLSANDDMLRRVAYTLLDQLLPVLQASDDWKERRQVLWLLVSLKSSIPQRDPLPARLPMLITQFAAHAIKLALTPWHYMYPLVNGFLLQRPCLDLEDVPMFYSLFHAATPDVKRRKQWILQLLVDGLCDVSDYALYRRRHVVDLCLDYASSPFCDVNDFKLILELLSRAADIDGVLEEIVMQHGVLVWVQTALNMPMVVTSPALQVTMFGLANRVCRRLCTVKSRMRESWINQQIQNIMTTMVTRADNLFALAMTIETLAQAESQDIYLFTLAQAQMLQLQLHSFKSGIRGDNEGLASSVDIPIWAYPDNAWNTHNLFVRCITGLFELVFNSSVASYNTTATNSSNNSNSNQLIHIRECVTRLALTERVEPSVSWLRQAKQSLSSGDDYHHSSLVTS
ncbi:ribosome 60S biogenesis N-terminal-domain-containing protein [Syncephalis plumigaleata]|nr:ribosome 60S biogenesis N-terminal-domain-containing protein [Syncephalis plumigaleata]